MNQAGTTVVRPGGRVWWQGEMWTVESVDADGLILRGGERLQRTSLAAVVGALSSLDADAPGADNLPLTSTELSDLTPDARRQVQATARAITKLLESDGPWTALMEATAAELGVTVRDAAATGGVPPRRGRRRTDRQPGHPDP